MSADHPIGPRAGDRRFICTDCGTKWFVPAGTPSGDPDACPSCEGALAPIDGNGQPAARS